MDTTTCKNCDLENSGVDLNRNYGYSFASGDNSEETCSETYRGPNAFSEPETRAMRDFITEHKDEIKFVMNFHAFGNLLVIPFNGNLPNDLMHLKPEL
jgi:carboxypeptidase T